MTRRPRKRRSLSIPQFRNRSAAKIDCRRQPEGRGEAESKEHHLPDGYETGSQDRARGSETGEQAWSQIAPKFRAHGAETSCGTTRAPHQGRSGCSTQGGQTIEDDRRTGRATTRCRLACGNKRPSLVGNRRSGFESKAQRRRQNLLTARAGGLLHEQGQGAQKV